MSRRECRKFQAGSIVVRKSFNYEYVFKLIAFPISVVSSVEVVALLMCFASVERKDILSVAPKE